MSNEAPIRANQMIPLLKRICFLSNKGISNDTFTKENQTKILFELVCFHLARLSNETLIIMDQIL